MAIAIPPEPRVTYVQGIPLETFRAQSSDGRSIAAYRFGNLENVEEGRLGGRKILPIALKNELYKIGEGKCAVCAGRFEKRYLQVDHRVPYEIAGDIDHPSSQESKRLYALMCCV